MSPPSRGFRLSGLTPSLRTRVSAVAPNGGSDFPLYWTFRYGPSKVIRLPTIAPPRGLDFLLWSLLGNQTFRHGPSQGIGLSAMSPPGDRTLRCGPYWRIDGHTVRSSEYVFFGMRLPLKGQSMKMLSGGTMLPNDSTVHA
jgi:hypothetical protein